MAYSRRVATSASLLARRYRSSMCYALHDDDSKHHSPDGKMSSRRINSFLQPCFFGGNPNTSLGLGTYFQRSGCLPFSPFPSGGGLGSCRYMSAATGDGSEKVECISDVAEVLSDSTVDAAASTVPVLSEVAVAAADSFPTVALIQHLIDHVHSFTGLNWWASIALTTFLIRGATVPLLINILKTTSKLTLMRPRLDVISQEIKKSGMHPKVVAEGKMRMQEIFKEYGVTPLSPLKGIFIQGPIFISVFLAITNMASKVPSFKEGGALWFTDLSTPDSLYIFPVLTGLSFWLIVEYTSLDGLEGNPFANTMKKVSRFFALASVFFSHYFPKAVFCYWLSSNTFSLAYGFVIKHDAVKEYLGIPKTGGAGGGSVSPWSSLSKKYSAAGMGSEGPFMSDTVAMNGQKRRDAECQLKRESQGKEK